MYTNHGDTEHTEDIKVLEISVPPCLRGSWVERQFVDFVPGKNCVMKIKESRNCLLVT